MVMAEAKHRDGGSGESAGGKQHDALHTLFAGAEILPSQVPSASNWTPELHLAGAVFAQAMADLRLRRADGRDHVQVSAALRWMLSNDSHWPLSFLRCCELLRLDPVWVRETAGGWLRGSARRSRARSAGYRQAA
jgi:hypothetical protein